MRTCSRDSEDDETSGDHSRSSEFRYGIDSEQHPGQGLCRNGKISAMVDPGVGYVNSGESEEVLRQDER